MYSSAYCLPLQGPKKEIPAIVSLENSQFDPNGGNKNTRACVGVGNMKILLKIDYEYEYI